MGILTDHKIDAINHYAPLHYLPFIARSGKLLGKPALKDQGFAATHLRSMSSAHDIARGFGEYGFLTLDRQPRILAAKLKAGFPHIGILVPAKTIEGTVFSLCRYNVAMTRYLRRGNKSGFEESSTNGRYYETKQIPIAREDNDKISMLNAFADSDTMIEVLVEGGVDLPPDTTIVCYSDEDSELAAHILEATGMEWAISTELPAGPYNRDPHYVKAVSDFVAKALAEPDWRGNGLEFDRV